MRSIFCCYNPDISIHALREEGDLSAIGQLISTANFYPRPPRGGRQGSIPLVAICSLFLSTPSARRATAGSHSPTTPQPYFYPRPPRGGRQSAVQEFVIGRENFYPRPPRGGRLANIERCYDERLEFLSTPSARRATATQTRSWTWTPYFYPRPPRGGRRTTGGTPKNTLTFLSTPSARRATRPCLW